MGFELVAGHKRPEFQQAGMKAMLESDLHFNFVCAVLTLFGIFTSLLFCFTLPLV